MTDAEDPLSMGYLVIWKHLGGLFLNETPCIISGFLVLKYDPIK